MRHYDETSQIAKEIIDEIEARIQAFADKNNISLEEARKRANLTIDGVRIDIPGTKDEQD